MLTQERLHTSWMLELPNKNLERLFWEDGNILRTYTYWDSYISLNMVCSNLIVVKTLLPALLDMSVLRYTWHMHANFLGNLITCGANLAMVCRYRDTYTRHRHNIIFAQRLLRLVWMVLAVVQSGPMLQAAVAKALNKAAADDTAAPLLGAVIMNLTRPLFVAPVITMAHASWVFRTKMWLPLQVITTMLAIFGSQRHQPCRMAADPGSALLLQATCRGVSELHMYIAGLIFGPLLYVLWPTGIIGDPAAACGSSLASAATLMAYAQAAYGMLFPFAGFCTLEWRLKAKWVREVLGQQLVYGPFGWPQSEGGPRTFASALQNLLTWMLSVAIGLFFLWWGCTMVTAWVGRLPCQTCEDRGNCRAFAPCDSPACTAPGEWTAVVIYLQMMFVLIGHLLVTRFV